MTASFALCCLSIGGSLAGDRQFKYAIGPALVIAMTASAVDQIEFKTKPKLV